jgi:uncharacterized membrane protein
MKLTLERINLFFLISIGGIILFSLWRILKSSSQRKWLLFSLRLLSYLILLAILFNLTGITSQFPSQKHPLLILIDTSESMNVKENGKRRIDEVKSLLLSDFSKKLHRHYQLFFYCFNSSLQEISFDTLKELKAEGKRTNLGKALRELSSNISSPEAEILLFSDGNDNGEECPLVIGDRFSYPVHCIGVGSEKEFFDLKIEEVKVRTFAFENKPVEVEVMVTAAQSPLQEIPVFLKDRHSLIATKKLTLKKDTSRYLIKFLFTPQSLGKHFYKVSLPFQAGELSEDNNTFPFTLRVIKDKFRVLYICGRPSWEYKFLRMFLKNDPRIELVSFVILRNPQNYTLVPENQLTLIPFPTREIFKKELFNFDLLIFENFSYRLFFPKKYLENIKKFVAEKGGSFIMLGGENSFGSGGYKNTPLEEILPVVIKGRDEKIYTEKFQFTPTTYTHPITNLGETLEETQHIWLSLPPLTGCNEIAGVKPKAIVLGKHSFRKNENGFLPLMVIWQCGQGRVIVLATNTTWRWALAQKAPTQTSVYYTRFWHRVIRWAVKLPLFNLISIKSEKKKYPLGERVKIEVKIKDEFYQPLPKAHFQTRIEDPQGKAISYTQVSGVEDGTREFYFTPTQEGEYKIKVSYHNLVLGQQKASEIIVVEKPRYEFQRLRRNTPLLKSLAQKTGGHYYPIEEVPPELGTKLVKKHLRTVRKNFWHNPFLYLLICALLSTEWWISRRGGRS